MVAIHGQDRDFIDRLSRGFTAAKVEVLHGNLCGARLEPLQASRKRKLDLEPTWECKLKDKLEWYNNHAIQVGSFTVACRLLCVAVVDRLRVDPPEP